MPMWKERAMSSVQLRQKLRRLRFLPSPHYDALFGARLERITERRRGATFEIEMDVLEMRQQGRPKLVIEDGAPAERVRGAYVPRRLRFPRADWYRRSGPFAQVESLSEDDSRRGLFGLRKIRLPHAGDVFIFNVEEGELGVRAHQSRLEAREGDAIPFDFTRRWTHAPMPAPGLVPAPRSIHRIFAGDPITIQLRGRRYRERLFIGGMRHQDYSGRRPAVDAVLNLCDMPNAWLCSGETYPGDRWAAKGEGRLGFATADLLAEADWVVARLRAGARVLVHCYAGINRSATVCCAALMLLEGISAEAALARVRERHPEAWPDPYHWLILRWLATTSGSISQRLRPLAAPAHRTLIGH
jgi:hypothetical protein